MDELPSPWRRLLPNDTTSHTLSILAVVAAAAVYLWRTYIFYTAMCLNVVLLGAVLALTIVNLVYVVPRGNSRAPLLVLVVALLAALVLPRSPSPDENLFAAQRGQFEQVIALAKAEQLPRSEQCAYALPDHLRHLSRGCLLRPESPTLVLGFAPGNSGSLFVYADAPEGLYTVPQCVQYGQFLFTPLDDHWYLCTGVRG